MAQNTEFKIFYYTGSPLMKLKSKATQIERDKYIDATSTITIPENAYVVVTNKDEIPLGISKPGEYNINDIQDLYKNVGDGNLTEEFFEYIAGNMIKGDDTERRSGGVYRAVGDLMINPFDSAMVVTESILFEWENPNSKKMYLKIFDTEDWTILCDIPSNDSSFNFDTKAEGLIEGKNYAWVMAPVKGMPQSGTELMVFKMADKNYRKAFNKELKEVNKSSKSDQMRRILKVRVYIDNQVYPIPPYTEL